MLKGQNILVTGGTGSWGYELIQQLLQLEPQKIVILSRSESSQVEMKRALSDDRLVFCIGDVRDKPALISAFEGIDYVFHLAALKHVPVCEDQPLEALKTNVLGTQNVIDAAIENKVKKVINVSTDKAADPANFYGMTKAIGEKLIIAANQLNTDTIFLCVRGGNVLGTSGSVLHLFEKQIELENTVKLTDKRMTRFFITPEKAIQLLIAAAEVGVGGEIFIINSKAMSILDLAHVMIEASDKENVQIVETGLRPGEKFHEVLVSENEAITTVHYLKDYLVILPTIDIPGVKEAYKSFSSVGDSTFSSKDLLMTQDEIKELLQEGKFI